MRPLFPLPVAEWRPLQVIALLGFSLLAIFTLLAVINLLDIRRSAHHLQQQYQRKLQQDLQLHARYLREQVVNVQQWLTDISVTRAQDGLDQGFLNAHRSAALFRNGLVTLRTILHKQNPHSRPSIVLEELEEAFAAYEQAGYEMAVAYIQHGPLEGNPRMQRFDAQATALIQKVADLAPPSSAPFSPPEQMESRWFHLARLWQWMMGRSLYANYYHVQHRYTQWLTEQAEQSQLAQQAQALREDLLQIQQWLTDASATRLQTGMEDGIGLAQERADHFLRSIGPFQDLLRTTDNLPWQAAVAQLEEQFYIYYATGLRMVEAYVQEGTQRGNLWMKLFDQQAEQAVHVLQPLLDPLLKGVELQEFQVALAVEALAHTQKILWVVLAVLILSMLTTTVWLYRSLSLLARMEKNRYA
ncbi:MAG: hypothetical protein HQL88_01670 [Magnetococcales bacterium]|nr:hypothetical protein [Magnetococcales bacterium]